MSNKDPKTDGHANILRPSSNLQNDKGGRFRLTISGTKSRTEKLSPDALEKAHKNYDQFKLSVLSKTGSNNNSDSELELTNLFSPDLPQIRSKSRMVLSSYKQELEKLTSKVKDLENQLRSRINSTETAQYQPLNIKTTLGTAEESSANFKDQLSKVTTVTQSLNPKLDEKQIHITLLKKHNHEANLTIATLQKAQAAIEEKLSDCKSRYQELRVKLGKLKTQYTTVKQKAQNSSQIVATMTSKIIWELTTMVNLMSNDSSSAQPVNLYNLNEENIPKTSDINNRFNFNVRSKFHPQTIQACMLNSLSKNDDSAIQKTQYSQDNSSVGSLGSIWHKSILNSLDEIQHKLCMSCAVQTLTPFKSVLELTKRLQLIIKNQQLEVPNEAWPPRLRPKIDSLLQTVQQFAEMFNAQFTVPVSAKLIF